MRVRLAAMVVTSACLLSFAAAPLQAASLENIQGEVLVDRGGGFAIIGGTTPLDPGNAVIANPGGKALIVYSADCTVSVNPGDVVIVHESAPCGGSGDGGGSVFNGTPLLIGGAVIGLGAGAAVLLGGDDEPASP